MKKLINLSIAVGIISLITGIISRIMLQPFFGGLRVSAHAFLQFSGVCLLLAIALGILKLLEKK